ncbi:MAG: ABC transporter substrate-binding protein [Synergistaceae bacterium]|jgi:NitT/TauT family transport system substrate-binding protein|nr:ABC transporter substrate-binding protein [Synergistaceae bacterium]
MKKYISLSVAILVLALAGAAFAGDALKIRVGADSSSFSYQFRVAEGAGIFEKYDIDAEVFTFSYGIDTLNAAILGETDSAQAADFAVASRLAEGNNLRILSHILTYNRDGALLYANDPAIESTADLKGKKVGVQKATVNEYVWGQFFAKQGLKPDDVEQVYLSSHAELLAAFQARQIDAFWVARENESAAKEVDGSHKLGDYELAGFYPRAYVLLDKDFIAKNAEGAVRFLRALDEATAFINEKPDEAAAIAAKDLRIPLDAARAGIDAYHYEIRLSQEDIDDVSGVAEWSIANGLIKTAYDVKEFIYLDAIKEAFPDRVGVK